MSTRFTPFDVGYTIAVSPHAAAFIPARGDLSEPDLSRQSDRRWGRFWGWLVSGWVAAFIVSAGIGLLIMGPLRDSAMLRWDRGYPVDLQATRTSTGELWSHYGSTIGDTLTVILVAVAVGIVLLIVRHWASVLLLTSALLIEVSIFVASTVLVPRDRPDVEQLDVSPPTSSYPSGHTAAATALALSLAVIVGWNIRSTVARVVAWCVALGVGPIVGFSRMYRGMHHPLDVVVGSVLGVFAVLIAFLAVRAWVGSASEARRSTDARDDSGNDRPERASGWRVAS